MNSLSRNDQSTVYLTTRPQRLGILPTMRFWNTRTPVICAAGFVIPVVVACTLVGYGGVGMVSGALAGMAAYWLPLGLFERYIRRRIRDKNRTTTRLEANDTK
jgi:hypothetical protein